jgi:hypothetical protein
MAKHYNPLKMWGSWVGAIIGLILFIYSQWYCMRYAIRENQISTSFFQTFGIAGSNCSGFHRGILIMLLIPIIFGFLIGYVLTILYRRLRK